jgi:thiosulfate/3-mercaptopyruvate sulfurtransferase
MKVRWIVGIVVLVVAALACPVRAADYARPELIISTGELAGLLTSAEVKILDVRKAEDYKSGHIPRAISLPRRETQSRLRGVPGFLAPVGRLERLLSERGIKLTDTLVLYDETLGKSAGRMFWTFEVMNHPKVRVLNGGMSKWAKEGRPISKEMPSVTPGKYTAKLDWTKFADGTYVLVNLNNPQVALVDNRSPREFSGEVASRKVRRAGRIPGSQLVDWEWHLTTKNGVKVLKGADELAKMYEDAGATKDKEVITYCRTGVRSSHGYMVLKLLGYPKVRNYDGSLIEWGNRPELPMERERVKGAS